MPQRPRLTFIALNVAELDRSLMFYQMILGEPLEESHHDSELNDIWYGGEHAACTWTDGAFMHFALYPFKLPERPVSKSTQVGFHIDNLEQVHNNFLEAGVDVLQAPRAEPWGKTARYSDPDGNIVSITERGAT